MSAYLKKKKKRQSGFCTSKAALMSGSPLGSTDKEGIAFAFSCPFAEAFLLLSGDAHNFFSSVRFGFGIQQRIKPRATALHNINKVTVLLKKKKENLNANCIRPK